MVGAFGAAAFGSILVSGLTVAGAVAVSGVESVLGRAGIYFDVFGWSVIALLVGAALAAGLRLATPLPLAATEPRQPGGASRVLGTLAARVVARLATVVRALDIALAAMGMTLVVGGTWATFGRWSAAGRGTWRLTEFAPVNVARITIVAVVGFMVLTVWRRRADEESRKRVGGTTWGNVFLVDGSDSADQRSDRGLLHHEQVHAQQWADFGSGGFRYRYGMEFTSVWPFGDVCDNTYEQDANLADGNYHQC